MISGKPGYPTWIIRQEHLQMPIQPVPPSRQLDLARQPFGEVKNRSHCSTTRIWFFLW
jgi:hypothetical protein